MKIKKILKQRRKMLTSTRLSIMTPSASLTKAMVGCLRKSTAPTSTAVASAPSGIFLSKSLLFLRRSSFEPPLSFGWASPSMSICNEQKGCEPLKGGCDRSCVRNPAGETGGGGGGGGGGGKVCRARKRGECRPK